MSDNLQGFIGLAALVAVIFIVRTVLKIRRKIRTRALPACQQKYESDFGVAYKWRDDLAYFVVTGTFYRKDEAILAVREVNYHPEQLQFRLVREPSNKHDRNAVAVYAGGHHVGYIPAELAPSAQELIKEGEPYFVLLRRYFVGREGYPEFKVGVAVERAAK